MCPFSVRVLSLFARSFSWKLASPSSVLASLRSIRFTPSHCYGLFSPQLLPRLPTLFHPRVQLAFSVTPFTPLRSTGFSACYPSTTPFGLALVPDFPRADEPSSGILGFSVRWILTIVPLLTPAFSLPAAPHVLSIMLLRHCNAPLPQNSFYPKLRYDA